MPLPAQSWTVSCASCSLVIGSVEGGRFVHDATCTRPLTIGAGLLRCCQCGGRLAGQPQQAVTVTLAADVFGDDFDDDDTDAFEDHLPPAVILPFARRTIEDTRQRL